MHLLPRLPVVEPPHRDLRQGASLTLSLSHSRARADHLHCTRFTFALTSQENEGFLIQHFGEITAVIKEPGCYFVNVVEREMTWKSLKEQVIDTLFADLRDAFGGSVAMQNAWCGERLWARWVG